MVGGMPRELPVGSHLDAATGTFTGMPMPGHFGPYEMSIVQGAPTHRVVITVLPAATPPQ